MIALLTLAHFAAMTVKFMWVLCVGWNDIMDFLCKHKLAEAMRQVAAEAKPFYVPAVFAYYATEQLVHDHPEPLWLMFIFAGLDLLLWFLWRNRNPNDDDRWKRRRKRAADAVRKVGARLVVVPVPAPSRS